MIKRRPSTSETNRRLKYSPNETPASMPITGALKTIVEQIVNATAPQIAHIHGEWLRL